MQDQAFFENELKASKCILPIIYWSQRLPGGVFILTVAGSHFPLFIYSIPSQAPEWSTITWLVQVGEFLIDACIWQENVRKV